MAPPHLPHPARKSAFAVFLLLLLLALQELVFRVSFPMPEVEGFNRSHYSLSMAGKYSHREPMEILCEDANDLDGYSFIHQLNLYGFRGPNFRIAYPEDRQRVLFIGDSFTEGIGAPLGYTIPEQFESMVSAHCPAEAINLGITGNGLWQYFHLAKDAIPLLKPDHVYLMACWNDLPAYVDQPTDPQPISITSIDSRFTPRLWLVLKRLYHDKMLAFRFRFRPTPLEEVDFFEDEDAGRQTEIDQMLRELDPRIIEAVKANRFNGAMLNIRESQERYLTANFDAWDNKDGENARRPLERIAEICRQNSCGLTVVYIPSHLAIHARYRATYDSMRPAKPQAPWNDWESAKYRAQQAHYQHVCNDLRIPFIDTTDAVLNMETGDRRLFWPYDGHCNLEGYRFIARICADSYPCWPSPVFRE
ncbi:MAG: SGNH/GDSL hydrolase family protein [Planctomycetota bacterium]